MMKLAMALALLLLPGAARPGSTDAVAPPPQESVFTTLDVLLDSGDLPLAAWQVEIRLTDGRSALVGVEGGQHPAFKDAPHYDPKALRNRRVIIGAFSLEAADALPKGRTRVATLHLELPSDVALTYASELQASASVDGQRIETVLTLVEGE